VNSTSWHPASPPVVPNDGDPSAVVRNVGGPHAADDCIAVELADTLLQELLCAELWQCKHERESIGDAAEGHGAYGLPAADRQAVTDLHAVLDRGIGNVNRAQGLKGGWMDADGAGVEVPRLPLFQHPDAHAVLEQ
jgi:hypothetical protein